MNGANGGRVTVEVPRTSRYLPVVRIVAGGMVARLGISYDGLEDLQLAMDSVLAAAGPSPDPLVVAFEQSDGEDLTAALGPFSDHALHGLLTAPAARPDAPLGLSRVLASLTDGHEVDGEPDTFTVLLRKR